MGASISSVIATVIAISTSLSDASKSDSSDSSCLARAVGSLRPQNLPGPTLFRNFHNNATVDIHGTAVRSLDGSVLQINHFESPVEAEVTILPSVIPRNTIARMRHLLREYGEELDTDPDPVDAMP